MKIKRSNLYLVVFTLGLSCSVSSNDPTTNVIKETPNNTEEMKSETLIVSGTAIYKLEVGFGTIFDLEVENIVEGDLKDTALSLVIIEETYNEMLINSNDKHFNFHFIKEEENFQENRMTESGIVDSNKTAWKLTKIDQ